MADWQSLTLEQIAEDFCSANPGKTAIVAKGNKTVIRDPAGNVHVSVYDPPKPIYAEDPEKGVEEPSRQTCPDCYSSLEAAARGGVRCTHPTCGYWFCF